MLRLLAALVLTVALGLLSRLAPIGWPVYDKSLGDALRGLVALGKMSVPQGQTDLLRLYDSVQVDQAQKSVKITTNIAPDLIDKLLQLTDTARGSRQKSKQ